MHHNDVTSICHFRRVLQMAGLADAMGSFPEGSPPSSLTSQQLSSIPPSPGFSPVHPQAVEFTPASSGRSQKHRGVCKAIRFRGENSLKAVNIAGTAPGSGSCCAVECQRLGGSSGESHTLRLLWPFCTFSLAICSWPLLQTAYQAGCPPVW